MRCVFGLALCLLLMVFAVATKAAAYHRQQNTVRTLTHTKVWQNNQDASAVSTPDLQFEMLVAVVALLCLLPLGELTTYRVVRPASASDWYVPLLAVRPPPAR